MPIYFVTGHLKVCTENVLARSLIESHLLKSEQSSYFGWNLQEQLENYVNIVTQIIIGTINVCILL